jgi:hypothetical protein
VGLKSGASSGRQFYTSLSTTDIVVPNAGRGLEPQGSEGAGIKSALLETLRYGREFPKELFYAGTGWDLISRESYQTFDELKLIEENLDDIIAYVGDSLP